MTVPTPNAPLSATERLAWRATGLLMTGACGALTVWGLVGACPERDRPGARVEPAAVAVRVAPARPPAPDRPRGHRCG